jgi:acetolactate synthase I/II/III large subunit
MSDRYKVSDLIAKRVKNEVDTIFGVTGGCVVNLVDSFYKEGIRVVPMHHEQSAAIAADAYARFKGFGACFGTSGPGTTNLTTGVACSYYDSIPVLAIGGQVPRKYLTGKDRQMGFQEVDGVSLMKPITKFSKRMDSLTDLEKAIQIAQQDRKGPSFLEIPDDYQRDMAEDTGLKIREYIGINPPEQAFLKNVIDKVMMAEKPLLIIGNGARDMNLDLKVPFLYTWGMKDKLYNEPYCKGDFGITGSPNGNRMVKESDLIVMLGTRMDSHQVPNWEDFAPQAYKIAVGLEFPHKVDMLVNGSLRNYSGITIRGNNWGKREENSAEGPAYKLIDELCNESQEGDIIIPDMGQIGCIAFQRWKPKKDQRLFNGMNHSPMGYSLPASIGACMATGRRIKVIVGDGSLMMNLQDLQTIKDLKLPIDITMVSNGGYGMIKQTQDDWKQYLNQGVACNFEVPSARKLNVAFGLNIKEYNITDTRIQPKWKYGEKL